MTEDHRHPRLGDQVRELAPLLERQRSRVHIGHVHAFEPLQCQYTRARIGPVHTWYMHMRVDQPFFRRVFVVGMIGAGIVYGVLLLVFASTVLQS